MRRKKIKTPAKMRPTLKGTEEYIFPLDLKMWAKTAGRKFKKAYDIVTAFRQKDITVNAYWDADNNIIIRSEDNTVNEKFKDG